MTALVRSWLLGITGAAILAALAAALTPEGAVKKAGRLAGGLLLFLAVIRPIAAVEPAELAKAVEGCAGWGASAEAAAQISREEMKSIIAGQAAAYILDKADAAGFPVRSASVSVSGGEEEYPVPWSVTVDGPLTPEQRQALTEMIERSFAIPAARQTYQAEEEGRYG